MNIPMVMKWMKSIISLESDSSIQLAQRQNQVGIKP